MATVSGNSKVREAQDLFVLPIDNTVNAGAINASDACYFTANGGIASYGPGPLSMSGALIALLAAFVGISKDKNPLGSGGIINPLIYAGAQRVGVFAMKSTPGDTYSQFAPVTLGADAQTITLAPVPAAPGATLAASGSGGTWAAAAHSVVFTYMTAIGETTPGPASSVTTAAGNNIVITLTNGYLPAWASGVCVYIDGQFAGFINSTAAVTLAGPLTGISATRIIPLKHALAIGYVDLQTGNTSAPPNIVGGTGITVPVRIQPLYPVVGLR